MGSAAIHSVMMVNFLYVEILMAASRIIKESGGEPREVVDERMWEQNLFGDSPGAGGNYSLGARGTGIGHRLPRRAVLHAL